MFINIRLSKLLINIGWILAIILIASITLLNMNRVSVFSTANKIPKCSNLDEIIQYINSLGWEIDEKAYTSKEVVMPKNLDEIYQSYETMQRKAGFRPDKYRGKKVTEYCFEVKNLNSGKIPAKIRILHSGKTIVAADLYSYQQRQIFLALESKEKIYKTLKLST